MAGAAANDVIWLDVLPSMKGFGAALTKQAGPASAAAGAASGASFGKAALAGIAVVAGGAALATKALYNIGATFDDMSDTIRVGTGASGKNLDSLVESAKNVGREVPASFEDIGTTLADLNTRLGVTGPTLEKLSSQFLEAGRILGEEIDVQSVTGAFSAFKIEGEATTGAMDTLFQVSQATGVGMNDLGSMMAKNGGIASQLGFNFEETASLLGVLDKAGVNSRAVMASMQAGLVKLAKDGEAPQDAFKRVTGELQGFIDSGNDAAALNLAGEVFGTRGAGQMIAALKSGKVNLDDLAGSAGLSGDGILEVAKETADLSEQWQIFKNRVMLAVEPVATRVFNALGKGMDWMNKSGVPAAQRLGKAFRTDVLPVLRNVADFVKKQIVPAFVTFGRWMADNKTVVATFVGVLAGFLIINKIVKAVAAFNLVLAANPIGIVVVAIAALAAGLVLAYRRSETFRNIVNGTWAAIKSGLSIAWSYIQPVLAAFADWVGPRLASSFNALKAVFVAVFPVIKGLLSAWWSAAELIFKAVVWYVSNVLGPIFSWLWNNIIGPVFSAIGTAISWAWNNVISPVFGALSGGVGGLVTAFTAAKDGIKGAWDLLVGVVEGPINVAKGIIAGFIDLINQIPGVSIPNPFVGGKTMGRGGKNGLGSILLPSGRNYNGSGGYAEGGWTGPGGKFTPAGLVHADEFVISKAARRRIESQAPGVLDYMNKTGQLPLHGSYAGGGRVVPGQGKQHKSGYPWATWAGDYPNPTGTPVNAWKSGVIALVKSMTTSYGKHIRMTHGDGTSSLYAHLSSFAKSVGDRVSQGEMIGRVGSTGNSTGPHLHFEALGGSFDSMASGGSIWDSVKTAGGQIGGWVQSMQDKANIGGLFGNVSGLMGNVGGGVKDWVLDKLFDSGGLAAGTGFMAKNTIAPERVLSDRQTRAFEQMVRHNFGDGAASGLTRDDLDYLADRIGETVLAGAHEVSTGVTNRREYESAVKSRVPGAYSGGVQ